MTVEIRKKLFEDAKTYDVNDFNQFVFDCGWADWMNKFTDAADGEEFTEAEALKIDLFLREIFYEAQASVEFFYKIRESVYENDSFVFEFINEKSKLNPYEWLIWGEDEARDITNDLNDYIDGCKDDDDVVHFYDVDELTEVANAEDLKAQFGRGDSLGR